MDYFISNDKVEKYEIEPFNNPLVQDKNIKIAILIPNEDNTDFIYQYINPKLAEYFNLSAEDFFGRSINILFGKLRNKIYRIFKEVYETHQKDIMHINYYQENELKFRLKLNITFIEEGYLLVTAEDTSAEIHIKELHSFSKSSTYIQKSKKYGIGTKFENGFYIWSDGLYKIIDRKPLSYDKMHNIIYELIIPEERAKLEKFKQNLIDHPEKSCKDYFKILTNSNKTKTILLDIKKIFENNHLKKTAIIVHDVTEELETEKRYNILNDLNSFIYNNLNIASFIISYETNYYYASKNISEMFHLSKKQTLSKTLLI